MAIEKSNYKVSRVDPEFSPPSRDGLSSDEDDLRKRSLVVDSDDELNDADSGAGSDDYDLLELGEAMTEFCQVGNQTCSLPIELYDLPGLSDVLSLDVWNEFLSEEDRFNLTKYLPDMDQGTYMRTLKELFLGSNFHFESPISKLFDMLKGGKCEPRVALYRQGLDFLQKHEHYHLLRKHQNNMVSHLYQIREAWFKCKGYNIDEKLNVVKIMRSEWVLDNVEDSKLENDSSGKDDSAKVLWNQKLMEQKMDRNQILGTFPALDYPPHQRSMATKSVSYSKPNMKGTLKVGGVKTNLANFPYVNNVMEMKPGPYGSTISIPTQNKAVPGCDLGAMLRPRDYIRRSVAEENMRGLLKTGNKFENFKGDGFSPDNFTGLPRPLNKDLYAYGRNKKVNQLSDIEVLTSKPSKTKGSFGENMHQYAFEDQMKSIKGRVPQLLPNLADRSDPIWSKKRLRDAWSMNPSYEYVDTNVKRNKGKTEMDSFDLINPRASLAQNNDRLSQSLHRSKSSRGKTMGESLRNGGQDLKHKGVKKFVKSEETESDSSEQSYEEDEDDSDPLMMSKPVKPFSGALVSANLPTYLDSKNSNSITKTKKGCAEACDGITSSKKIVHTGEDLRMAKQVFSKTKQKGKVRDKSYMKNIASEFVEHYSGAEQPTYNEEKNEQFRGEFGDRLQMPPLNSLSAERRHKRNDSLEASVFGDDNGQGSFLNSNDRDEMYEAHLMGCNTAKKKRKGKEEVTYIDPQDDYDYHQNNDFPFSKKQEIIKVEDSMEVMDQELETKPQKKMFTLIIPTVHSGFSFSIMHLLSAVRMVLITPHPEDSLEQQSKKLEDIIGVSSHEIRNHEHEHLPSLTVQEIVNRVRSNPGDPCILETQEPLQDLVRGVLKTFLSRTPPLGAKGWKPLVSYEKSSKCWNWIGPVSQNSLDHDESIEEATSPEAWGLPYKMLVKLVDSFANWLKSSQETLQQIGSLPAPPSSLMEFNLDSKDRFKDLRAQKSLNTISPSSEEVRAYFRREEFLRYSIPDRAFLYMAADGKKSIVAPLRRCGGKPTSKARDHFMLKRDRPPHVTILCLVRDAASRLPESIGTRADVCTLIRDSQYIVDDVSDAQVNQVVSGALDRLHYERDPCVQFDSERKLWVYLHREREEEDFEDDGTSSTKKCKRQKKDDSEQLDQGAVTVAFNEAAAATATEEPALFDLSSSLNVEQTRIQQLGWESLGTQENKTPGLENSVNEDFDDEGFGGERGGWGAI